MKSPIALQEREVIDPVYGWDSEITGFTARSKIPDDLRDFASQLAQIATEKQIAFCAARLMSLPSKAQIEEDIALALLNFQDVLADQPYTAIAWATQQWIRRQKWRPAPSEILELTQQHAGWIMSLARSTHAAFA